MVKSTYGRKNIEILMEMGNVETLLISEGKEKEFGDLIEKSKEYSTEVEIISETTSEGKTFAGLGGIGAFMRWEVPIREFSRLGCDMRQFL